MFRVRGARRCSIEKPPATRGVLFSGTRLAHGALSVLTWALGRWGGGARRNVWVRSCVCLRVCACVCACVSSGADRNLLSFSACSWRSRGLWLASLDCGQLAAFKTVSNCLPAPLVCSSVLFVVARPCSLSLRGLVLVVLLPHPRSSSSFPGAVAILHS